MDKDQSAVESFLKGTEGSVSFEQQTTDPFAAVEIPEQKEEEVKEEKPLPFHKDPKIQKFIAKEIEKGLKDVKTTETERKNEVKEDDDFYVRLIGNDTPEKIAMIKEAKARDARLLDQAEERLSNRLSQKEEAALRAEKEAEEELANAFESIEENYEVDISSGSAQSKKTRQEFISFVEKIAPKDSQGNVTGYPDMNSAWETFSEIKKSSTQPSRAKDIASRSLNRSTETVSVQPKRMDWNAVDEMMDSLK